MSDNTLGDLTNNTDLLQQQNRQPQPLGEKDSNAREALKHKLDFKKSDNGTKQPPSSNSGDEKENEQRPSSSNSQKEESCAQEPKRTNLEDEADKFSNTLTERRSQQNLEEEQEEESDSDSEEDNEDEDEKENARNRLKALLGGSAGNKKKQAPPPASHRESLKKSVSQDDRDHQTPDLMYVIDKLGKELYDRLEIVPADEVDEDTEVSKIFYEGREGQEYAVKVIDRFFEKLRYQAKNFLHQTEAGVAKPKESQTPRRTESEPEKRNDRESDKERIKRKLNEEKKMKKQGSSSNKESLKSLLGAPSKAKSAPINDIKDAIKVDSFVLNYGVVNPGKLLGSILNVKNVTDQERVIELTLDQETETYDKNEVIKDSDFEFLEEITNEEIELTEKESKELDTDEAKNALLEKKRRYIGNSENQSQCWFIENPQSKDLVKKITLKLGAGCEQEFIIVLKTMQPKSKMLSLSFLKLELPGVSGDYNQKSIKKEGEEGHKVEETIKNKQMKVMLCGVVEPPELICCKQVYDVNTKQNKVPLALKPTSGTQKFRIQFRNNGSKEVEADFSFVKIGEQREKEFSMNEYLEFFCMPGTLKIPAKTTSILNVMVKVNMEKVRKAKQEGKLKVSRNLFKLLIAKMTDSSLLFSYFFDVTLAKE